MMPHSVVSDFLRCTCLEMGIRVGTMLHNISALLVFADLSKITEQVKIVCNYGGENLIMYGQIYK